MQTDQPREPQTERGRTYLERLRRDDAGLQQLSSGRFHLGAIVTDAEDAILAIEAEAAADALRERDEAVRLLRDVLACAHAGAFDPNGGPYCVCAVHGPARTFLRRFEGEPG